jgi:hypothetical protein
MLRFEVLVSRRKLSDVLFALLSLPSGCIISGVEEFLNSMEEVENNKIYSLLMEAWLRLAFW